VWVPCVALPSGGGSSVGPSPLCGSPVWVPCAGPLCGSPVWVHSMWVPCVGPLCGSLVALRPCGIYSRDVSRSFTRSRSFLTMGWSPGFHPRGRGFDSQFCHIHRRFTCKASQTVHIQRGHEHIRTGN